MINQQKIYRDIQHLMNLRRAPAPLAREALVHLAHYRLAAYTAKKAAKNLLL
ncbi:MAG: hypothetical protein JRI97_04340 [Deltaproteobacteria bacterium]|nr:hypothetical protein [Deltaproteobacteria bacterium]